MSTNAVIPDTPDPFNGQTPTLEEYNHYRDKGELPERFKPVEAKEETPEAKAETAEGKEPSKAEQEKPDVERDEATGKFKAKEPIFTEEQQKIFDREFRKREAKLRREIDEERRTQNPNHQATAAAKEPETDESSEPQRPTLPKLADYKGTVEEYDKELEEYPAKLQAFNDAQRQSQERTQTLRTKLVDSEKAAKKAHPDYAEEFDKLSAEIQAGEEIGLPNHVLKAIAEDAEDPHEVNYYLVTNREEFHRLSSLNAKDALREVLKIDVKLQAAKQAPAKPKKVETQAPPPPDPVGARPIVAAFDANDENLSPDEWLEKRNAQIAAKRKRA